MRKLFSVLALAAVVLFTANCGGGGNTPASIEKSMYTQMQKGNYDKVVKIMIDNLDATKEQKAQFAAFFTSDKIKKEMEKGGGLKSFEIIKEEISEDGLSATVETKVINNNGDEDTKTTKYVKKDGKWLMSLNK